MYASMGGSCFNVWGAKCKVAIAQLCLWPANAENLLNREFLSCKQRPTHRTYWTWLNMSAFPSGKGLFKLAGETGWLAACVLNSSVVAAAIKVPATFWTVQDTMGASGQATSASDKEELELNRVIIDQMDQTFYNMISELPWKFQVLKWLVNFLQKATCPALPRTSTTDSSGSVPEKPAMSYGKVDGWDSWPRHRMVWNGLISLKSFMFNISCNLWI